MKRTLLFLTILFLIQTAVAQTVNIPDTNFKNALLFSNCIDTDGDFIGDADADLNNDGEIDVNEANMALGIIIDTRDINSLQGIEAFTNIKILDCKYNNLTTLDVSQNSNLERLECRSNNLVSLDVSSNLSLNYLDCNSNNINSISLGNNSNLEWVLCSNNQLTEINVSQVQNLKRLSLFYNQLTSIDVTNNLLLEDLFCSGNQLSSINLNQNTNLDWLEINLNQLTSLDISQNLLLETLACSWNQLTSINTSLNTNLTSIFCSDNSLTELNIKNENNININLFNATNNPDLTCIQVDDVVYAQAQSTWTIDSTASYNTNCGTLSLVETEFQNITFYPNPTKEKIYIKSGQYINKVIIQNLLGQIMKEVVFNSGQKVAVNAKDLATGSYFISVFNENNKILTKHFIKE